MESFRFMLSLPLSTSDSHLTPETSHLRKAPTGVDVKCTIQSVQAIAGCELYIGRDLPGSLLR